MSLNSRCQCQKCGCTFSLFTEEMKLLPSMKIGSLQPKKILKTWTDWVAHIATHCPDCRIRFTPKDCLDDYEKHKNLLHK